MSVIHGPLRLRRRPNLGQGRRRHIGALEGIPYLNLHAWKASVNKCNIPPCMDPEKIRSGKRASKEGKWEYVVMFGCRLINQLVAYAASIQI